MFFSFGQILAQAGFWILLERINRGTSSEARGAGSGCCGLIPFVELAVDCEAAVFVARHAGGAALIELIFTLYQLSLCGGNVGCESEQKVVGDALLHC
jgi:hypothetical protein